jgi:hypothetical protein
VIEWLLSLTNSTVTTTVLQQSNGMSLTDWTAAYGAVLSTILALFGAIRWFLERSEKRPRIQVTTNLGFSTVPGTPGTSDYLIYFEAANVGERPVTLNKPCLILPDGRYLWLLGAQGVEAFPHELLPGKNCTVWEELREVAMSLSKEGFSGEIKVVCMFRDAVGNSYKSKPMSFGVDHWLAASLLDETEGRAKLRIKSREP